MSDRTLLRALECLELVRPKIVVVGGTAHRFFLRHELGSDPGFELLTTEDVDLAAPLELHNEDSRELLERLLRAGFVEEVQGADYPSYTYRSPHDGETYLQFIAPLSGSGTKRDGSKDHALRLSGILAEKLRHVDLLLYRPYSVSLQSDHGELPLQVVNPVAFVVQKLLILRDRGSKRGKDLLYIYDTLSIFGDALDRLADGAADLVPNLSSEAQRKIRRAAHEFCFVESRVTREAAEIASEQRSNPPGSRQIVEACHLGLRRILGSLVPTI